jgi:hypothetical protein
MGHKPAIRRYAQQPDLPLIDLSRSTLDVLLGEIFAPIIDGQRQLPQLAPVDSPMPADLERKMAKWLIGKPCAVCGGTVKVQAHHLYPRHIWPQLMYREEFWYPLCRANKTLDCHCDIGHGGNMSGFNPYCVAMAELMRPILWANKLLLAEIRGQAKRK